MRGEPQYPLLQTYLVRVVPRQAREFLREEILKVPMWPKHDEQDIPAPVVFDPPPNSWVESQMQVDNEGRRADYKLRIGAHIWRFDPATSSSYVSDLAELDIDLFGELDMIEPAFCVTMWASGYGVDLVYLGTYMVVTDESGLILRDGFSETGACEALTRALEWDEPLTEAFVRCLVAAFDDVEA